MLPTVSFCLQFLYNLRLFRHCEGTAAVWFFFYPSECVCSCRQSLVWVFVFTDECLDCSVSLSGPSRFHSSSSVRAVGAVLQLKTYRCLRFIFQEGAEATVQDTNTRRATA